MKLLSDEEVFGNPAQGPSTSESGQRLLSDADVFGSPTQSGTTPAARDVPPAAPASTSSPKAGLSDEDVFETAPGLGGLAVETGSAVAQGALPAITSTMKGMAARTAKVGGVDPAFQHPGMERLLEPYAADVNEASPKLPPTEQPLYRAATALEKGAENVLPTTKDLNPHWDAFSRGVGSVGGNIVVNAISPAAGLLSVVEQGRGEALDNAVQKKATPEQQIEAANSGTATFAGATDLIDSMLPFLGKIGRSAADRIVTRLAKQVGIDAVVEGGQEAFQQFLQNLVASHAYNPGQPLGEDVVYNGIIGGLVGGFVGGIHGRGRAEHGQEAPDQEPTPEDIYRSVGVAPPMVQPSTQHTPLGELPSDTLLGGSGQPTEVPPPVSSYIQKAIDAVSPGPAEAAMHIQTAPKMTETPVETTPDMAPAEETVKAKAGVNVARVVPLLSTSLYGNESIIPTISVKEMFQNAYDAIKTSIKGGQKEGNIDIRMDPVTRTISMSDDGQGMTPEILSGPFLEVAGTGKEEDADSSGGLGIAKLLFLYANQAISVTTMRNGKVSELTTTGNSLFRAMQGLEEQPNIVVRKPTQQDSTLFPKGHGTIVTVKVPETYTDTGTGKVHPIPFEADPYKHPVLHNSPLFAPINVTFNGDKVYNSGTMFPSDNFTPLVNGKYDWGDARIYVAKQPERYLYNNVHVLSNGIWQFSLNLKTGQGDNDKTIPYRLYVDLKPSVKPTHPGYPFAPNRQSFREQANQSIQPLFNYLSLIYKKAEFDSDVKGFGGMTYVDQDGKHSAEIKLVTIKPPSANPFTMPKPGEQIHVENGKMTINGRAIPELTPEQLKDFDIDFAEVQIDQKDIDPTKPLLHDNVQIKRAGNPPIQEQKLGNQLLAWVKAIDPEEKFPRQPSDVISPDAFWQQSMTEFMREKYGVRFGTYMHNLGSMFSELRDAVAAVMGESERIEQNSVPNVSLLGKKKNNLGSYSEMLQEGVGISFDTEYRGVSIKVPFSGMFINPAATEFRDTLRAAIGMFGTMIHELAHFKVRSHNASFPAEMQRELINLETLEIQNRLGFGVFDIQVFKQRLTNLVSMNDDINQDMYGVLDGSFGSVSPRGKRFGGDSEYETGDGSVPGGDAAKLAGRQLPTGPATGSVPGQSTTGAEPRSPNVHATVPAGGGSPDAGRAANNRALGTNSRALGTNARALGTSPRQTGTNERALGTNPRSQQREDNGPAAQQPEFRAIRQGLTKLFGGTIPPGAQQSLAHADKMNSLYKWTAGLLEVAQRNPYFKPLIEYTGLVRLLHLQEARLHEVAQRVSRRWRDLGVKGDRLAAFLDDMQNMVYRTPQEAALGIGRHPTQQEQDALAAKHGLDLTSPDSPELKVYNNIKAIIYAYHQGIADKIIERTRNNLKIRPGTIANKVQQITNDLAAIRNRPWFPMMRFGEYFIHVKDAQGNLVWADTFERKGPLSAERVQQRALKRIKANLAPGHEVFHGIYPENAGMLLGLPRMLLEEMANTQKMTPTQLETLLDLQNAAALGLQPVLDPRYQRRYQVPGFATNVRSHTSLDARRSFAKFFFYGAKYYAKLSYIDQLKAKIEEADQLARRNGNIEGKIVRYMNDHLQNNIVDIRSDWGFLKGAIFTWAMGGSVAAATANGIQTIGVTAPFLGAKFGEHRAIPELVKAMFDRTKLYKRGWYLDKNNPLQGFEDRALGYSIQTGRITETMAPELAALAHGAGLFNIGGNRIQNGWVSFQEKSAMMFETIEQFNRRVAFTAALRLALKNNTAKVVDEAVNLNKGEYDTLISNGIGPAGAPTMPVTAEQARAIIAANHIVDQTQFNYASVFRPRIMRGKGGTVLVFKRYIQSLYYMLGGNKDVMFRYLIYSMFLSGGMGLPFMEELIGLVKAASWWGSYFGVPYIDLEKKAREWIIDLTNGTVDPDLVLHGFARRGWGVAHILDMMGSLATGKPGRGLEAPHQDEDGNKIGGYQNIPAAVLDRSKAVSPGGVVPIDFGVFGPEGAADTNRAIAQSAQKASGAAFSVAFNLYKAAMNIDQPGVKRWELVMPRMMASASAAIRSAVAGQDTGKGGEMSLGYNMRDPEEVMELIAMGLGYQPLRKQLHWDSIMAQSEINKFYEMSGKSLKQKYFNAMQDGRDENLEAAYSAIEDFDNKLPDWASGYRVMPGLRASIKQRQKEVQSRETGIPLKRSQLGVAEYVHKIYPGATINVQRPEGDTQ